MPLDGAVHVLGSGSTDAPQPVRTVATMLKNTLPLTPPPGETA